MSTPVPVQPERILKELGHLWGDLAKAEEYGVLRACSMTLIVVAEQQHDTQALGEMIGSLMQEHPSRAIVVRVAAGSAPLEARVLAQCWMPFGKRQQICCEQIEFMATPDMLQEAAAVIRGLTVPDLPVVLYCPDPALLSADEFAELVPLAHKLILDSDRGEDSAALLRYLTNLRESGVRGADLAWSRLTPWREAVAQIFDNTEARRSVYSVEDIRILYAHADEPVAAYYLAGWFMQVLGGQPHIHVARGVGPDYGHIARVSLHGQDFEAWVELLGCCEIEVRVNGMEQRLVFPADTEYRALRQELSISGKDALYDDVLGLAALLRGVEK